MTELAYRIVDVNEANLDEYDLFCKKSKKKEEGYQNKVKWVKDRFKEGLRIKLFLVNEGPKRGFTSRGFSEYIPGEYAWRVIDAKSYMIIHCLWVVGRWKGRGYGSRLLNACIEDARKQKKAGVAVVTSSGTMLADKKVFLKNGFESVDSAPPSFELLVKKFRDAPSPTFPKNWDERLSKYGSGLTVIRSYQCPYLDDSVAILLEIANEKGIKTEVIELKNSKEAQNLAPSAYGVFNIVYNGKLLSYHCLTKKELLKLLK